MGYVDRILPASRTDIERCAGATLTLLASKVNTLAPTVPHDGPFSVSSGEGFSGEDSPYWSRASTRRRKNENDIHDKCRSAE